MSLAYQSQLGSSKVEADNITVNDLEVTGIAEIADLEVTNTSVLNTVSGAKLYDSTCSIINIGDSTKRLKFDLLNATTNKTTTIKGKQTDDRIITLPDENGEIVTVTNIPNTNDVVQFDGTNKLWKALNLTLSGDANGELANNTVTSLRGGTLTLPVGSDTLVGRLSADVLYNKTLSNPNITAINNSGLLTLPVGVDTLVGRNTIDTLTNKTLTNPIISTISNTGTLTLPTGTRTLVARDTVDTLTNKTLTNPIISTISNTGTITLPTLTDTLVGRNTVDTLTNKTLTNPIVSSADNKLFKFDLSLATTSKSSTLKCKHTVDRVITIPDESGELVTVSNVPTTNDVVQFDGTNKLWKALNLTLAGDCTGSISNNTVTRLNGNIPVNQLVTLTGSQYLEDKIIQMIYNVDGGMVYMPYGTGVINVVSRNAVETLTNKTLTNPIISTISNTGTLTLPTGTRTLVARDTVDTLTNKTLTNPIISDISNNTGYVSISETGDQFGPSKFIVCNRVGANGGIIDTSGSPADLCDFQLKSNTGTANFRYEKRSTELVNSGNTTDGELQFYMSGSKRAFYTGASVSGVLGRFACPSLYTSSIYCNNVLSNKIIALYDSGVATDNTRHDFYGFGISPGFLRYQMPSGNSHGWFVSTGNTTSTTLMTLNSSKLQTFVGLQLPTAGGTASLLDHYEEYTHTTTFSGAYGTPNIVIRLTRVGKQVTAHFPTYLVVTTSSSGFNMVTGFPTRFRPVYSHHGIALGIDGSNTPICHIIAPEGGIQFLRSDTTNFQSGVNSGWYAFSTSWVIP